MTAQISDTFIYNDKEYSLVAISEEIKLKLEDYGITPSMISTACWRGYYCKYIIKDEMLYLDQLTVRSADGNYPKINGKLPIPDPFYLEIYKERRKGYDGPYEYSDLKIPVCFNGKMVLGKDFLREYYIHMGFQNAWAYKELLELEMEKGSVVNVIDHSKMAEELRQRINADKEKFYNDLKRNIPKFIGSTFSLGLEAKAWWIKW